MSLVAFPTRDAFMAWLDGLEPSEIISHNGGCVGCPLSVFLRDAGMSSAAVFSNGQWSPDGLLADDDRSFDLPDWARAFVGVVDHCHGSITVSDCIRFLDPWVAACELDRQSLRRARPTVIAQPLVS